MPNHPTVRRAVRAAAGFVVCVGYGSGLMLPAQAASTDRDGDGMPNRWETSNGLNPDRANARGDADHDALRNLAEFRLSIDPTDEDSDNDGADDGDEVRDGFASTDVDDDDKDDDGTEDGDENADRDGLDNEDEDDAKETCLGDDDDTDSDNVSDEDENDFGTGVRDADSDNDGIEDGDEDADEDGEADEDADDSDLDDCDGDTDNDGEADEDEADQLGTITSFDNATGTLVVLTFGDAAITGVVTEDTEIEFEDTDQAEDSDESEASTADLQPGVVVAELEFDDETGTLEEIEIYQN